MDREKITKELLDQAKQHEETAARLRRAALLLGHDNFAVTAEIIPKWIGRPKGSKNRAPKLVVDESRKTGNVSKRKGMFRRRLAA